MDWNLLWLIPVGGFFVFEFWALKKSDDSKQPLTYWIRKAFRLSDRKSPLYWIAGGIIGWLAFHFLVDK